MGTGAVSASLAGAAIAARSKPVPPEKVMDAENTVKISLHVNGAQHAVLVESRWTLLYVLREAFGMTGTKEGCSRGECGACTVLIDGIPRYACMTLAVEAEGRRITTLEGLMSGEQLGPVQNAFLEEDAYQCGYCTPGQIMAVEGLLRKNPTPSLDEIRIGVSGNLCRCGAYTHIFRAAQKAADLKKR
ncbi:MAG: (2Fe-2S)-binding protein [Desulfobacterales bacterium]|nr:(2Fe-2S)-binding protein [Desulfobacterales bacterium]MBS3755006.1 (2Fe-2S)-binding protein [Desulfobacterales bacterium]